MGIREKWKNRARKLKSDTAALYLAFKRKDTPLLAKIVIGAAVCYTLSPIDLIPDFIPVLGYLDDLLLVPFLIALAVKMIPAGVLEECRAQAAGMWQGGKPKRWLYALPVAAVWAVAALLIVKIIWK